MRTTRSGLGSVVGCMGISGASTLLLCELGQATSPLFPSFPPPRRVGCTTQSPRSCMSLKFLKSHSLKKQKTEDIAFKLILPEPAVSLSLPLLPQKHKSESCQLLPKSVETFVSANSLATLNFNDLTNQKLHSISFDRICCSRTRIIF